MSLGYVRKEKKGPKWLSPNRKRKNDERWGSPHSELCGPGSGSEYLPKWNGTSWEQFEQMSGKTWITLLKSSFAGILEDDLNMDMWRSRLPVDVYFESPGKRLLILELEWQWVFREVNQFEKRFRGTIDETH